MSFRRISWPHDGSFLASNFSSHSESVMGAEGEMKPSDFESTPPPSRPRCSFSCATFVTSDGSGRKSGRTTDVRLAAVFSMSFLE